MTEIRFDVKVRCVYCDTDVSGQVVWDGSKNLFDTPGFFAFGDGICCDYCENQLRLQNRYNIS